MKLFLASLTLLIAVSLCTPSVLAGRLDIAVVQYGSDRDPDQLAAAFAQADLAEVTNSDSIESKDTIIRGGNVVFAQSLYINPGTKMTTSTRLGIARAEVTISLSAGSVSAEIIIEEGVDVGIRKFTRQVFSGSSAFSPGQTKIIGLKQSSGRSQTAVKGRSTLTTTSHSTLVLAQYTP